MNIYVIGAIVAVGIWGATGVVHGLRWTVKNTPCILHHGVKLCKAKTAAPAVAPVAPDGFVVDAK